MPACARTSIRSASSTGRFGGRASERFVVTVEFKPKPTAMAVFRKLIDENSRERESGCGVCVSRCSCPWADARMLLCEIYNGCVAFDTHYQPPCFAAFNRTSADLGHEQER